MSSLKKVLLNEKFEIIDKSGKIISLFGRYFKNFDNFEGEGKFSFQVLFKNKKFSLYYKNEKLFSHENPLLIIIFFDFYIRENIFPLLNNFLILHASSISDGENAILISGRTGSGKSLLTFLLSKKNFYMGDDLTPLIFKQGKVLTGCYPQPIALYKDFKNLIDDEEIMESEGAEKVFVFPKRFFQNNFLPLKCIIFPVSSKFNRVERMKKSRAFLFLSSVSLNSSDFIKSQGFDLIEKIVYTVPVFQLFWKSLDFLTEGAYEIFEKSSTFC